jgi:hypothetical protein
MRPFVQAMKLGECGPVSLFLYVCLPPTRNGSSTLIKQSVDGGTADLQPLSNRGAPHTLRSQLSYLSGIDRRFAPLVDTACLRRIDPFGLPLSA